MVFSSLFFLFAYLPAVLALYYILPARWRNPALLVFNLVFYGWGEPVYVLLMLLSILVDYALGIVIEKYREKRSLAKGLVAASLIWNLGLLFFFKYYEFAAKSLQAAGLLKGLPLLSVVRPAALPIGISFYTFQKLSYIIDVYRGTCEGQKSFVDFSVFVTLFPQLIAGPILQYKDLAGQLRNRAYGAGRMREGIRFFTIGLCKKVLLANSIGELWDSYRQLGNEDLSMLGAWIGLLAFCFQIYFDFSGYSDMAVGLGKMLGFDFKQNFNYPYISRSITEFWRRWHISLSSWFRDYLYIPLGGNRKGKARWMGNLLLVWAATGIWHGAGWNFLLWGLYFALLLMAEKLWLLLRLERLPKIFGHLYALFFIMLGWAIFAVPDMADPVGYFHALAGISGGGGYVKGDLFQLSGYALMFVILILASLPVGRLIFHRFMDAGVQADGVAEKSGMAQMTGTAQTDDVTRAEGGEGTWKCGVASAVEAVLIAAGLVLSVSYLVDSTYNPFLYFRF